MWTIDASSSEHIWLFIAPGRPRRHRHASSDCSRPRNLLFSPAADQSAVCVRVDGRTAGACVRMLPQQPGTRGQPAVVRCTSDGSSVRVYIVRLMAYSRTTEARTSGVHCVVPLSLSSCWSKRVTSSHTSRAHTWNFHDSEKFIAIICLAFHRQSTTRVDVSLITLTSIHSIHSMPVYTASDCLVHVHHKRSSIVSYLSHTLSLSLSLFRRHRNNSVHPPVWRSVEDQHAGSNPFPLILH